MQRAWLRWRKWQGREREAGSLAYWSLAYWSLVCWPE